MAFVYTQFGHFKHFIRLEITSQSEIIMIDVTKFQVNTVSFKLIQSLFISNFGKKPYSQ